MSAQTIRDLTQLAQLDEVEAFTTTDGDIREDYVPEWCELVLQLKGERGTQQIPLARHDGELIIEVLFSVLHPQDNFSHPVQRLWRELDDVMDFLMVEDPEPEDKARAKALAEAITMLQCPYSEELDLTLVKQEAVSRWEERQE